mmetsp:Transcript_10262/g.25850  ORF Transcript_10262/g.25850 Transcript_10262/m.25850 type:complete len:272 (-) Transcript_10262:544-1359(-)
MPSPVSSSALLQTRHRARRRARLHARRWSRAYAHRRIPQQPPPPHSRTRPRSLPRRDFLPPPHFLNSPPPPAPALQPLRTHAPPLTHEPAPPPPPPSRLYSAPFSRQLQDCASLSAPRGAEPRQRRAFARTRGPPRAVRARRRCARAQARAPWSSVADALAPLRRTEPALAAVPVRSFAPFRSGARTQVRQRALRGARGANRPRRLQQRVWYSPRPSCVTVATAAGLARLPVSHFPLALGLALARLRQRVWCSQHTLALVRLKSLKSGASL